MRIKSTPSTHNMLQQQQHQVTTTATTYDATPTQQQQPNQRRPLTEEFIALWKEHRTLWEAHSPLYRDKHERSKSYLAIGDQLSMTGIYLITTLLRVRSSLLS